MPLPQRSIFFGCEAAGGGNGIWQTKGASSAWCTRVTSTTFFDSGPSLWYFTGCALQAITVCYTRATEIRMVGGNVIDPAGAAIVGVLDVQRGLTRTQNAPLEFCNGAAGGTAIVVETGGYFDDVSGAPLWGLSTAFGVGVRVDSGAAVVLAAAANRSFPATVNYSITGHNIADAGVPLSYPRAGCYVAIQPDPAAVAISV